MANDVNTFKVDANMKHGSIVMNIGAPKTMAKYSPDTTVFNVPTSGSISGKYDARLDDVTYYN